MNLTHQLKSTDNPVIAAKLIELHRSLGHFSVCENLARRWGRRFESNAILQFSISKYLFHRHCLDGDNETLSRCKTQLEKSFRLDPVNYQILLYLSTLLLKTRAFDAADQVLERARSLFPDDSKILALCSSVVTAKQPSDRPSHIADVGGSTDARMSPSKLSELESRLDEFVKDRRILGIQVFENDLEHLRSLYLAVSITSAARSAGDCYDVLDCLRNSTSKLGLGDLKHCRITGKDWKVVLENRTRFPFALLTDNSSSDMEIEQLYSLIRTV
jgi:hypothetical protein